MELFSQPELTRLDFEQRAWRQGARAVAGVDEAGRGPLAGPVVAAAVILPPIFSLPGLDDSKKLTARQRDRLYPLIREQALAVGIGVGSVAEIDRCNILQATLLGMRRAIARLAVPADYLLIDGVTPVPVNIRQMTIKQGDSRSLSIAAASVVAKVVRDRIMQSYDRLYPQYGFARHKGYGSLLHRQAVAAHGPSPCHRRSFAGVREHCPADD